MSNLKGNFTIVGSKENFESKALKVLTLLRWEIRFYSKLNPTRGKVLVCLLYTSDAADEEDSVDLGGRRIIKITFWAI